MMKKIFVVLFFVLILAAGGFFYFSRQVYYSQGSLKGKKIFEIAKGEGNAEISSRLKNEGIISDSWYFYYYLRTHELLNKIIPGKYELSGLMSIPDIASVITSQKKQFVAITFPEGMTANEMADKISQAGLDGQGFLNIAENPKKIAEEYDFLKNRKVNGLEGYLFPDTYYFGPEAGADVIVKKLLDNFGQKIDANVRRAIDGQAKTLEDIVILASMIEKEVNTKEDREMVSGIFWNRLGINQPLQSDATLTYVLGKKKAQYSLEDTKSDSPYNTYAVKGLPPGPIANPGLESILAAVYPRKTSYLYFLSNPETGKTVFADTFEGHLINKKNNGL